MSTFSAAPPGSSIRQELLRGRVLARSGRNGTAQLRHDPARGKWIIRTMHPEKWLHFDQLEDAFATFRNIIGETGKRAGIRP